jgi:hypothetical protein
MEPLNDEELNKMLRQWQAPAAPPSLQARVLGVRQPWWRWLLTGSIRIPVPLGFAAAVLIVWILSLTWGPPRPSVQEVTASNFQPVKELKPRIIRRVYDTN